MKYTSVIELDQKALKKNISYLNKVCGSDVKFVSVIKGNAYGHGISTYVPMAEKCYIDYFAVFDIHEARQAFSVKQKNTKLMILGGIEPHELEWVIQNDVSFFVSDLDSLKQTIHTAKKLRKKAKIHMEIETGLHRTGVEEHNLSLATELIQKYNEFLDLEGICTHFAGAESIANYIRVHKQIEKFNKSIDWLKSKGITPIYYHTACSAAALLYPETRFNMVRIGIAQYGFWPSQETKIHRLLTDNAMYKKNPLKRILSWKSKIMGVKKVDTGEFIGYGISYQASHETRIATIPVGYFHGYRRSLSNVGYVLVHGKIAPILGMVNMSIMIVDITRIPNVRKWDEVVLIGKQGKNEITVASFSEQVNLVNYELLVRLPDQIPRVIINNKKKKNNRKNDS